jgi:hypothetical protein
VNFYFGWPTIGQKGNPSKKNDKKSGKYYPDFCFVFDLDFPIFVTR